ncbi:MAG: serine protease [Planctomycetota bacterium]
MTLVDDKLVGGSPLPQFASAHCTALLTGTDEVEHLHLARSGVQGVFRLNGQVCRTIGGCAAVPIDARGYWLTASHCTDSGGVLIYDPSTDGRERTLSARVVWRSTAPGNDLALLYAPLPVGISPVDVAPTARVGETVVCVGSGIKSTRLSAGHVVGVGGSTDGSLKWVEHDAPLAPGDSGGPAFYMDGLLAGINIEAGRSLAGDVSRATSLAPDMREINARIEADWTSHAASP